MSGLKAVGAAVLAAAVLLSPGCAKKPPPLPAAAQVPPAKANKPSPPAEASEETEPDDGADYGSPVLRGDLPLTGTRWEWEGNLSQDRFEGLDAPSRYSLEFKFNGWFDFKADCKHGAGMYEAEGRRIALIVVTASGPACRHGSRADDFLMALEGAKVFWQAGDKLYFELGRETKTMVFGIKP